MKTVETDDSASRRVVFDTTLMYPPLEEMQQGQQMTLDVHDPPTASGSNRSVDVPPSASRYLQHSPSNKDSIGRQSTKWQLYPSDALDDSGQDIGGQDVGKKKRTRHLWRNRPTFVLAAIGSAIGLGNFWRFPYLTYKYGGGTFLIPYVICLFAMGIPMAQLELCCGQRMQRGDIHAFSKIHPRLRGVGFASVFGSFFTVAFYTVIIAYSVVYLGESIFLSGSTMPWAPGDFTPPNATVAADPFSRVDIVWSHPERAPASAKCLDYTVAQFNDYRYVYNVNPPGCTCVNVSNALYHLNHEVLGFWNDHCVANSGDLSTHNSMQWKVYAALIFSYAIILGCILFGVSSASWAVWVTMPLPFILLIILLIFSLTLEGHNNGIQAYINSFDVNQLKSSSIWTDAAGQIFFSLSVCFGVLTSYGSYMPRDAPMYTNILTICIANSLFSFVAGFAVFGMLGHLAFRSGLPVTDVATAGFALTFVVYPETLSAALPHSTAVFFCVVLFACLFFLGIDSAFSFAEAITTVIADTPLKGGTVLDWLSEKTSKTAATPIISSAVVLSLALLGLLFCTVSGYWWIDVFDHFMGNFIVLLDGVLEVYAVGWVWAAVKDHRQFGNIAGYIWHGFNVFAIVAWLAIVLLAGSFVECDSGGMVCQGQIAAVATGVFVVIVFFGAVVACLFADGNPSLGQFFGATLLSGPNFISDHLAWVERNQRGIPWGLGSTLSDSWALIWRVYWGVLVKWILPTVLSFLILITLKKDILSPYGGYTDCEGPVVGDSPLVTPTIPYFCERQTVDVAPSIVAGVSIIIALLICLYMVFRKGHSDDDRMNEFELRQIQGPVGTATPTGIYLKSDTYVDTECCCASLCCLSAARKERVPDYIAQRTNFRGWCGFVSAVFGALIIIMLILVATRDDSSAPPSLPLSTPSPADISNI